MTFTEIHYPKIKEVPQPIGFTLPIKPNLRMNSLFANLHKEPPS